MTGIILSIRQNKEQLDGDKEMSLTCENNKSKTSLHPEVRVRLLFTTLTLILWFSRDLAWSVPWAYVLFTLCLLVFLPAVLLKRKWHIVAVISIYILSLVSQIYLLNSFSVETLRLYYRSITTILSFIDIFVVSNLFLIFLKAKKKIIFLPLAIITGLTLSYMIIFSYYRWE